MEDLVTAPWLRRLIIAALLAAFVLLGFRVMDPFIVPLVWAGILAFVSWPAYRWLRDKCRGHTTVAAVLMTSAMTAAVIVPLAWLAVVLRVDPRTGAKEINPRLIPGGKVTPICESIEVMLCTVNGVCVVWSPVPSRPTTSPSARCLIARSHILRMMSLPG